MKTAIFLLSLILSFSSLALTKQQADDAVELIMKIKRVTKNRWDIEPWREGILVKSKGSFIGTELGYSNIDTEPEKLHLRLNINFTLKVLPQMFPMVYSSSKERFQVLSAKSKQTIRYESMKGYDNYSPETIDQWKLFWEHENAKKAFKRLPEYYFRSLGLKIYIHNYLVNEESIKAYTLLKQDIDKIISLLIKYQLPEEKQSSL